MPESDARSVTPNLSETILVEPITSVWKRMIVVAIFSAKRRLRFYGSVTSKAKHRFTAAVLQEETICRPVPDSGAWNDRGAHILTDLFPGLELTEEQTYLLTYFQVWNDSGAHLSRLTY